MSTGVLFALTAFFAWGFGDLFSAVASKKVDSSSLTVWSFLVRISIFLLMVPFFWYDISRISFEPVVFSLLLGVVSAIGFMTYYKAFQETHAAIVGSIALSWGIVSLMISLIIFGEVLLPKQMVSICFIFIGMFFTLFNIREIKKSHLFQNRGGLYAFITMVAWGIVGAFVIFPIEQIGWFWTSFFCLLPFSLVFPFLKARGKKFHIPSSRKLLFIVIGAGLLEAVAELSYSVGIEFGQVSVVAPIAGSYAVLMVGLSFLVFKEKISRTQVVGILVTVVGIVTLSFLSF